MSIRLVIASCLCAATLSSIQTAAHAQYVNNGSTQHRSSGQAQSRGSYTRASAASNGVNYDSHRRWSASYKGPQVIYGATEPGQYSSRRGVTYVQNNYEPGFVVNQYGDTNQRNLVRRDQMPHYRYQQTQVEVDQGTAQQVQYNTTQSY